MRVPFIAGNWKMFKTGREAVTFAEELKKLYKDTDCLLYTSRCV